MWDNGKRYIIFPVKALKTATQADCTKRRMHLMPFVYSIPKKQNGLQSFRRRLQEKIHPADFSICSFIQVWLPVLAFAGLE